MKQNTVKQVVEEMVNEAVQEIKAQEVADVKEQKTNEVYFGTGEYRIDSKNLDRLNSKLAEYLVSQKWQWALQDCLGIKADGTVGPRFAKVQEELHASEVESVQALLGLMAKVVPAIKVEKPKAVKESKVKITQYGDTNGMLDSGLL